MSELKIGLIGGSGFGAAFAQKTQGQRHEIDTPFGKPSDTINFSTLLNEFRAAIETEKWELNFSVVVSSYHRFIVVEQKTSFS